ncbi:MAG TPA: protein kinase [Hyalangium sp.]|nr:protein kinase [Hyalangium sp.]
MADKVSERTETFLPPATPAPDSPPADFFGLEPLSPEPEKPDALIGQQLGEYVVRRYVGSGGMGIVYEGEHIAIGRKVAIKFIREELAKGPNARGLLTEARAASVIRHHGIIDIFGFGQQPGLGQYLVMEYLEGRPLDELVKERAPLPLPEALPLLCEVLDALSAAHAAGVIHRDLKPSNIFVVRQSNGTEHIKVLDFGLAKRTAVPNGTTAQTHSNLIVGTPQYMAPEQALGEAVGPQTDLYAVGIIAFELLTGQRPFPGRAHMEVLIHHLKTPPPVPSSLVALPAELDALVLRLLAKEPRQRPASASEVARELRALLQPRDGASTLVSRISRSIPVVQPASDAALPSTPTVSLSPAPPVPVPVAQVTAPVPPPPRRAGWRWATVVGGVLTAILAVGMVLNRAHSPEGTAPPAPVEPSPAPTQQPPMPTVSEPVPSLQPPPAPAPQPEEPPKPAIATPAPVRKRKPPGPSRPAPSPAIPTPFPAVATPEPVLERGGSGTLHLKVKGWADVWVDGQKQGRVPGQHSYLLPAGEHELELKNSRLAHRQKIVITPNATLPVSVDLSALAQVPSTPSP